MLNLDRISREFARQAAISSPSRREGAMARYLADRFTALGGVIEWDDTGAKIGGEADNLIARFAATGRDTAPLMLSVHMDTVEPCANVQPQLQNGIFTSAGETILGSDDKSGIAEIIEALEILREERMVFNVEVFEATLGECCAGESRSRRCLDAADGQGCSQDHGADHQHPLQLFSHSRS